MYDRMNPFVRVAVEVSSYNFEKRKKVGADHRIFYVNSGSAVLLIDGGAHSLEPTALVYIPADTPYEFLFSDPSEEICLTVINFDFDSERSNVRTTIFPTPFEEYSGEKLYTGYVPTGFDDHIFIKNAIELGEELGKIKALFFDKERNYRAYSSAILKTVLLNMSSATHTDTPSEGALGIVAYIREHYAERLLASELAARFNYHPNHLNRLVKRATGMGFKEYLIHYRLVVAKDKLLSTSDPVIAVSESCGFTSPSYFAELFTKLEGVSPREYRSNAKKSIV